MQTARDGVRHGRGEVRRERQLSGDKTGRGEMGVGLGMGRGMRIGFGFQYLVDW